MKRGWTVIELLFVVVLVGVVLIFPLWTQRNLNFWIGHFKGHAVHVPYWLALILSLVTNGFALAANILAEVAKYFL